MLLLFLRTTGSQMFLGQGKWRYNRRRPRNRGSRSCRRNSTCCSRRTAASAVRVRLWQHELLVPTKLRRCTSGLHAGLPVPPPAVSPAVPSGWTTVLRGTPAGSVDGATCAAADRATGDVRGRTEVPDAVRGRNVFSLVSE